MPTATRAVDEAGGGWVQQETSPDKVTTSYTHDVAGEVTSVTDGAGDKTSYSYDSLGRKTKVTYPDGTATTAGYDPAGNVDLDVEPERDGGHPRHQLGRIRRRRRPGVVDRRRGQLQHVHLRSDRAGDGGGPAGIEPPRRSTRRSPTTRTGTETLYTDGNGNPWWDTYNSWGLQESRIEPSTSAYNTAANSTFTTAYDADGRPVTQTEPGGVTVTDTYNNVDELTGQSGAGRRRGHARPGRSATTLAGNVTSASTSNTASSGSNATSESFTYNDRGQVLTASGSAGSTSYGYNGDGQVTSVADAAGTTGYTYDSAGRLATLADPASGTTAAYSYNPDSPGQPDLLRDGQGHPVVRLRRPAPADLRHAEDLLRHHRRLGRLRVQRRRGDHLPDHHRPGRAVVEHLHLRRGGSPHLLEQRDHNHGLRLRRQREPDPGRGQDLHLRRPGRADQRRDRQLHLHRPGHPVVGVGPVGQHRGVVRRLRGPGDGRDAGPTPTTRWAG